MGVVLQKSFSTEKQTSFLQEFYRTIYFNNHTSIPSLKSLDFRILDFRITLH